MLMWFKNPIILGIRDVKQMSFQRHVTWKQFERFNEAWKERIELMAEFILHVTSVLRFRLWQGVVKRLSRRDSVRWRRLYRQRQRNYVMLFNIFQTAENCVFSYEEFHFLL